jgi:hypothetical protein
VVPVQQTTEWQVGNIRFEQDLTVGFSWKTLHISNVHVLRRVQLFDMVAVNNQLS